MVKTYKQLINEIHDVNEGIFNRAVSSYIGGVAGGVAGGVLGGLGGAALETLGGIPGAAEAGLTGGISVGGASGLRAGLISGIEGDAEMARHKYETAVIHGWGRDHLDRFYKKYKDLVDTHNSLVMFKKNRMKLDPMLHEPLSPMNENSNLGTTDSNGYFYLAPSEHRRKVQKKMKEMGDNYSHSEHRVTHHDPDYDPDLLVSHLHGKDGSVEKVETPTNLRGAMKVLGVPIRPHQRTRHTN